MRKNRTRLFLLIGSLNLGGAERQIIELVKGLDTQRFSITVGLFYDEGVLRDELLGMDGVTLLPLGRLGRWDVFPFLWRLFRILKKGEYDVLYSFMPGANILGLIAARCAGVDRVVWGIRATNVDVAKYHWLSGMGIRVQGWLSAKPDVIIVNSFAGEKHLEAIGWDSNSIIVIQNGINTDYFYSDQSAGREFRLTCGVTNGERLIGKIARLDPMKDHITFFHAVRLLAKEHSEVRFLCVGDGPSSYKMGLRQLCDSLGISAVVLWMNVVRDMKAVYNALDICTVTSAYGEGFPNVIGEAMASCTPCVTTDVGDAALIVGETGIVVPINDPQALADGWSEMLSRLEMDPVNAGITARQRIISEFDCRRFVKKTSEVLMDSRRCSLLS